MAVETDVRIVTPINLIQFISVDIKKKYLLDLSYNQLKEIIKSFGQSTYRADQLLFSIYKKLAISYDEMTDLPRTFRDELKNATNLLSIKSVGERVSVNKKTRKVLFLLDDGKSIEATLMLYGEKGGSRVRRTICISSQVGCVMKCPFCATGQQGFERNLRVGEIIEQVLHFAHLMSYEVRGSPSERDVITNVVFMGMGEPLTNYDAVWNAIVMLNSPKAFGLGARQITISTSGLAPQIIRLARENIHVELAISLHAASNTLRNKLVPINTKYPLEILIPACREYFEITGRRPTFEYALFNGINDSIEDAMKLANLLSGFNCHVNLIAGNPTACEGYKASSMKQVKAFQKCLTGKGITSNIRASRGADIEAGCGQLRSHWLAKN